MHFGPILTVQTIHLQRKEHFLAEVRDGCVLS